VPTLSAVTALTGIMIVIGLVGIVVPVLPGLLLVWAGVAVWAIARHDAMGWATLALATALTLGGTVIKYLLPGRQLRSAGVGWPTLTAGAALGVVGFFLIPVVGLFVGFVLGVYLAERVRLGSARTTSPAPGQPPDPAAVTLAGGDGRTSAWASTKAALVAVGWSMAIELVTGLLVTSLWLGALVAA
jgi:uncharacterized protein YqgC (DUF456 family)